MLCLVCKYVKGDLCLIALEMSGAKFFSFHQYPNPVSFNRISILCFHVFRLAFFVWLYHSLIKYPFHVLLTFRILLFVLYFQCVISVEIKLENFWWRPVAKAHNLFYSLLWPFVEMQRTKPSWQFLAQWSNPWWQSYVRYISGKASFLKIKFNSEFLRWKCGLKSHAHFVFVLATNMANNAF